ncbi:hypothetical protein Sjap_009803 [Stephania japonica]|uniref:Amino acid transporter transmembrane domain-containing protein n=1 Tax=Stephania japonica TaxID=461633 RepID=A0AAP0JAE5_9MAGN
MQSSFSIRAMSISANPPSTSSSLFSLSHLLTKSPQIAPLQVPESPVRDSTTVSILEEGEETKINPQQDDWLPITASRNGNSYYAVFHTLNSGIGFQALLLPFSFTILGWALGTVCLSLMFIWKLYTHWLLIQLHESTSGKRCSRYIQLAKTAFAQMPNLNSIAWISLMGGITAIVYCTMIWIISIDKRGARDVSYDTLKGKSSVGNAFRAINALGLIAFALRGHNVVLEIQGTMPSTEKCPSRIPTWRGVKQAYLLISLCFFPVALAGYWAYGNKISADGGIMNALRKFHGQDTSKAVMGTICMLIIINYLCSFQIYAMPVFDNLESAYTSRKKKPCQWWVRSGLRALFGCLALFIAVAIPFLPSLAGLIGGIALPVSLAYPCFMWNLIEKPQRATVMWYFNWVLGGLGMVVSVLVVAGGIWGIVVNGVDLRFFKPLPILQ